MARTGLDKRFPIAILAAIFPISRFVHEPTAAIRFRPPFVRFFRFFDERLRTLVRERAE